MDKLKILFANVPADGHFNPLSGLAVFLKNAGHDVRWYTQNLYEEKIKRFGIHYYPFQKTIQWNQTNIPELFPQYERLKGQFKKMNFALQNAFILRAPEWYEDIKDIQKDFPFDMLIADLGFTAIPLVKEKLGKPVLGIGVIPLPENSRDLPPFGMGLLPSNSLMGKIKQHFLRWVADKVLLAKSYRLYKNVLKENGVYSTRWQMFDILYSKATLVLQSGTPGFEYPRSDMNANIRFVGPLFPYLFKKEAQQTSQWSSFDKLNGSKKIILVTQGTVEKDIDKLIVPALEAFKNNNDVIVVATTGASRTEELRKRFPQSHFIIEDFIPFEDVMPQARLYISNGGYGGVLHSIKYKLPMVVAGINEGKNEINARVQYFKVGINLKTETPKPEKIYNAAMEVINNKMYQNNIEALSREFNLYNPNILCEKYLYEIVNRKIK
jgi:UDP:flavonoid glycosyltransferase YjiC (YdhE family)